MAEGPNGDNATKKGLPYSTQIFQAVGIGIVLAIVTFLMGLFDDSRKAAPELRQQLALLAQKVEALNENQKDFNIILNAMRQADTKAAVIELRVARLEEENRAAVARYEAQYREVSMQLTNLQRALTTTKP